MSTSPQIQQEGLAKFTYPPQNPHYHALIDMGSNGVRFSISDLSPPTTRIMPTIFQDRSGISLYSAQFAGTQKVPIPGDVIQSIIRSFVRFQHICKTFGVPPENIKAMATEATREATNSATFLSEIKKVTGLEVELLSKASEGRIGAWGVASSLAEVVGLVMDLGGGSTQISWLLSRNGQTEIAKNPVSLPYGAAALTKRLETAINDAAIEDIRQEMAKRLRDAYESLDIPTELYERASQSDGFTLYLSGGGFRGFGYLLMSEDINSPYPIPIINGFSSPGHVFSSSATYPPHLTEEQRATLATKFRISARRARQIPAVAFLIRTLTVTLPSISRVVFCQGGVREGALYATLSPSLRAQDPLVIATKPYAPASAAAITELLHNACPRSTSPSIRAIIPALANMLTYHLSVPKESRSSCGLHCTTTGALASVHGLSHETRALISLALCQRWGGDVHDSDLKVRLAGVVGAEGEFWARYVGAVAGVVGTVFPAGRILAWEMEALEFWCLDECRDDGIDRIVLEVRVHKGSAVAECIQEGEDDGEGILEDVRKVGKKKKCLVVDKEWAGRKAVVKLVKVTKVL